MSNTTLGARRRRTLKGRGSRGKCIKFGKGKGGRKVCRKFAKKK